MYLISLNVDLLIHWTEWTRLFPQMMLQTVKSDIDGIIKGILHLLPKISMFCALSQNYQLLFEKRIHASYSKLFKELKNDIEILVGQVVFKIWIKTFKMLFGSTTQELLSFKLWCYFWVPWTIHYKMHTSFFKKPVDNFEIQYETC